MSEFRLSFDGPSVENGEIDVADLAPSLLALGELVSSANRAVNKGRAEVKLKIRATEKGSFEALMMLDVSWVADMLDAVAANPDRVTAAKDLIQLIIGTSSIGGGAVVSYFAALRFLRGKKADGSTKNDDHTTSITVNGLTIVVPNHVATLLEDVPTREATQKFVKTSLKRDGIKSVGFKDPIEEPKSEPVLILTEQDLISVSVPEPEPSTDDTKITQQREALLKIVSAQFDQGYLWRFSDGTNTFTANMEDPVFIAQIDTASVQLSKSDTLRCIIEETQELSAGQLKTTATITEVKQYISGAKQLKLL